MNECIIIYNYNDYIKKIYILDIKLNYDLLNNLIKNNKLLNYIIKNNCCIYPIKYKFYQKNDILYIFLYYNIYNKYFKNYLLTNINNKYILKVNIHNNLNIYYNHFLFDKYYNNSNINNIIKCYYNNLTLEDFNIYTYTTKYNLIDNDEELYKNIFNNYYNNIPFYYITLQLKKYDIYDKYTWYPKIFNIKINNEYEYKYIKYFNNYVLTIRIIENTFKKLINENEESYKIEINNYTNINIITKNNNIINKFYKKHV
jgi:hypothetical protein